MAYAPLRCWHSPSPSPRAPRRPRSPQVSSPSPISKSSPGGVPVHQLQRLLGHHSLQSTSRYVHWIVGYRAAEHASHDLLAALEQDHE